MGKLHRRFSALDRDFRLFLLATLLMGLGLAVDISIFNNYLKEVFKLDVSQRTFLELPRELPGFLVFFFLGALMALGDLRISALANLVVGFAMFGLGIIPPVYGIMLIIIFFYSTGQHIYMALGNSLGMAFAKDGKVGRKLGQIGAINTAAMVTGSLILLGLFHFIRPPYWVLFSLGGACFASASILLFMMKPQPKIPRKSRWIWRKEYKLFYLLSIVYGARKQLFLTFAPWVLVDVFYRDVGFMTLMVLIIFTAAIFIRPWVGRLIDTRGEKVVLQTEALIIIGVCLVYVIAPAILSTYWTLVVVAICYIVDQSANAVGMARATSVHRRRAQCHPALFGDPGRNHGLQKVSESE